jgi:serine/threonine protein kinase
VGGFGEVWKAKNPFFGNVPPVALKFCLDAAAKDRLLKHEAAILNRVMGQGKHPGIIPLQHTYLSADPPFLAYEYVEGQDLSAWTRDTHGRGMPVRQAAQIVQAITEVVAFAHALNPPIVHRDLKPANILIQKDSSGRMRFRVADFGIGGVAVTQAIAQTRQGKTRHTFLTTSVQGAYTPNYASPQQMRGESPDPRDDVYSLGVIWHQLLTGDLTKGCPSGKAWQQRLIARGMPEAMLDLLVATIEHEREDRPAHAGDLSVKLTGLLKQNAPLPPQPLLVPAVQPAQVIQAAAPHARPPRPVASPPPPPSKPSPLLLSAAMHRTSIAVPATATPSYALVKMAAAAPSGGKRLDVNLALVCDVSGYMYEEDGTGVCRLKRIQQAAKTALDMLKPDDTVAIIAFAYNASVLLPSTSIADKAKINDVIDKVDMFDVDPGGCAMDQGIQLGMDEVKKQPQGGRLSQVVVLTQGMTSGEAICRQLAQKASAEKVHLSLIGVGTEWNASLIKDLARLSNGMWYYIEGNGRQDGEHIFAHLFGSVAGSCFLDTLLLVRPTRDVQIKRIRQVLPAIRSLAFTAHPGGGLVAGVGNLTQGETRSYILDLALPRRPDGKFVLATLEASFDPGTGNRQSTSALLELTYASNGQGHVNGEVAKHIDELQLFELRVYLHAAGTVSNWADVEKYAKAIIQKGAVMGQKAAEDVKLAQQALEDLRISGQLSRKTTLALGEAVDGARHC